MNKYVLMITLIVAALAAGSPAAQIPEGSQTTVIEGATIIDGRSSQPIRDAVLVIQGDTIRGIGRRGSVRIPAGARRIDAAGKTIIPGLLSPHVHIGFSEGMVAKAEDQSRERIQRDANAYLYYGVTHVVSLGVDVEPMLGFLTDQRAGKLGGARVYSAGIGFVAKDGWDPGGFKGVHRPATPEEARAMVQKELQKNPRPDVLKIWLEDSGGRVPTLEPRVYGAIIAEAHRQGVKVFGHMSKLDETKELVRQGIDALVHSIRDREVDAEFLKLAKDKGITQLPMLVGPQRSLAYAEGASFLSDPGLPLLFPAPVLQRVGSSEYQQQIAANPGFAQTRAQYEIAAKNVARMAAAGIPIAVGTDAGPPGNFPGLWEHRELELLVKAGLTPIQAIQAATINGARVLRLEKKYGTLESGKVADFVVLNADPVEDITNTRKIAAVWMNGKQIDRAALARRGNN